MNAGIPSFKAAVHAENTVFLTSVSMMPMHFFFISSSSTALKPLIALTMFAQLAGLQPDVTP